MQTAISKTSNKGATEELHFPCISLILPLEPGVDNARHLEKIARNAESELLDRYEKSRVSPVIEKLKTAGEEINFAGNKKSVAIFVSPLNKTVVHLDAPLEETLLTDESFEIRDLAYSMFPAEKYLVLVQSAESFKIFLGNAGKLVRLKSSTPDNIRAYKNDIAEKIEYFSDTTDRKEVMMDKFIHHIDKELEHSLHMYKLPVFVLGTERMNGHFKKYTHNAKAVLAYIHGNYDDAKPHQLAGVIQPYMAELRKIEASELKEKIEQATGAHKISIGIEEVWKSAMEKKGRLLIVEKNYSYPHTTDADGQLNHNVKDIHPSLLKDAVDVIIERVLENGGEVKFADTDVTGDLQHIALLLYY